MRSSADLVRRAPLRRRDRQRLAGAAVLVAVILLVAAVGLVMAHRLAPSPTADQRVAVQAATRDAVQSLLTFSPRESEARKVEVQAQLTGRLQARYRIAGPDAVMGGVAAAGATSVARVVGVGVSEYGESQARILVFIDQDLDFPTAESGQGSAATQDSAGGSDKSTSTIPTVRWANMSKVDGNWRLADLVVVGGAAQ